MTRYIIENRGIVTNPPLFFRGFSANGEAVPRWAPNADFAETFPSTEAATAYAKEKMPHAVCRVVPFER